MMNIWITSLPIQGIMGLYLKFSDSGLYFHFSEYMDRKSDNTDTKQG
jgi:hypothetical protein